MRVIPVMDLLNSIVVRGVAGRRDEYRPVDSLLCRSADPIEVGTAFRRVFGFHELYVADLDAITSDAPNFSTYEQLRDQGFQLLVDCGLRAASDAEAALMAGAAKVIVGLETWPLLASLELLVRRIGPERLIFSLDLQDGSAMRGFRDMVNDDPIDIAAAVVEVGIQEVIVLDLASVGTGCGLSTLPHCHEIRSFCPQCKLITGGGVRSVSDLIDLESSGLDAVLVASAFHNGAISATQLFESGIHNSSL